MIITKDIVFLNFPKTGSSFLRTVIKKIYDKRINRNIILRLCIKLKIFPPPYKELLKPNIIFNYRGFSTYDQHGIYSQIPKNERNKKIVTIVRNPYERLLSNYEFRFWEKNPHIPIEVVKKKLPQFPNLSLDDYVDYQKLIVNHSYNKITASLKIGITSIQFIHFYFKKPKETMQNLSFEYLNSNSAFKKDIAVIEFLKQESLNENLSQFLLKNGYSKKEANMVLNFPKINKTKKLYSDRKFLLTEKAINYIDEYESFYLNVLRQYNIIYNRPKL